VERQLLGREQNEAEREEADLGHDQRVRGRRRPVTATIRRRGR
jgi:head-tail adaptor